MKMKMKTKKVPVDKKLQIHTVNYQKINGCG